MDRVRQYLGRQYRLVVEADGVGLASGHHVPTSGFLNQPPAHGSYLTSVRALEIGPALNGRNTEILRVGPCEHRVVLSSDGLIICGNDLEAISEIAAVRITIDF